MPGDFKPMYDALAKLSGDDLHGRLKAALAIRAEKLLLAGFRQSVDPYGTPWAPVHRHGPTGAAGKPLMDSNNLRGSRVSIPTTTGIEVGLAAPYASFQQLGTHARRRRTQSFARARAAARRSGRPLGPGGIRPRLMVPTAERGIGPIWGEAFERETLAVLRKASA